jgi:hypothetical protein
MLFHIGVLLLSQPANVVSVQLSEPAYQHLIRLANLIDEPPETLASRLLHNSLSGMYEDSPSVVVSFPLPLGGPKYPA